MNTHYYYTCSGQCSAKQSLASGLNFLMIIRASLCLGKPQPHAPHFLSLTDHFFTVYTSWSTCLFFNCSRHISGLITVGGSFQYLFFSSNTWLIRAVSLFTPRFSSQIPNQGHLVHSVCSANAARTLQWVILSAAYMADDILGLMRLIV